MKKFFKNLWYKLQLWDFIWSVPLAAFIFIAVGFGLQKIFGESVGFYDPSFLQAAFIATFVLVVFSAASVLSIYFDFRHVFKYYQDKSKEDFNNLKGWQRIGILLFLYCFFIVVLVILTKMFL